MVSLFAVNYQGKRDSLAQANIVENITVKINMKVLKLKIVFNAMERGIWGEEERTDNPFQIGEYYDIRLRAHPDYMRISCNRREIAKFKYRIPISTVNQVHFDGGFAPGDYVDFRGGYYANKLIPYEKLLIKGWEDFFLLGRPNSNAFRFAVNFFNSNDDIMLHFNPRFDEKNSKTESVN
ncbi:unnamed protein product [Dracunculus medinensis]|uniref:Galectin n=1 Tax=Dracunculus medinensis TaxID=318479 RepID=A0A0N4UPB3_DRAME|nr:unnamed protein product [Dracunculus medinensis]